MNVAQLSIDALERFGDYNSTFFEGHWSSTFELMDFSGRLAEVLRDQAIAPGDRVVVMMANCLEVSAAFQALAQLGAVVVPLMPQLLAREVSYIVSNSGARVVITSAELAPRVAEATAHIEGFQQILTVGETGLPGCTDLQPLMDGATPLASLTSRTAGDLALLVYTSGTTGHPKGVMISHGNLIDNTLAAAQRLAWPVGQRSMMALPMSHVYGILVTNLNAVLGGVTALLRKFTVDQALQTIQDFQVERCSLVPTMMVGLIHHPERENYDVSSLRRVTGGSAPLPDEVRRRFETLFDCRVYDGYGQSEATCAVCCYELDEAYVVGSAGRPLAGFDVCVQDDANCCLPVGETGELCFRGPSVMLGYWKDEAASRAAIIDGWLHSGDIGHIDERGYMYITDRKKDMIVKGGENISPRQIEEVLCRMDAVAEVAVVGVPDATYQEDIAAFFVLKGDAQLSREQVLQFAAPELHKFKLPKYIYFVEQLPKNSNGKILKRILRDQWIASQPQA